MSLYSKCVEWNPTEKSNGNAMKTGKTIPLKQGFLNADIGFSVVKVRMSPLRKVLFAEISLKTHIDFQ